MKFFIYKILILILVCFNIFVGRASITTKNVYSKN